LRAVHGHTTTEVAVAEAQPFCGGTRSWRALARDGACEQAAAQLQRQPGNPRRQVSARLETHLSVCGAADLTHVRLSSLRMALGHPTRRAPSANASATRRAEAGRDQIETHRSAAMRRADLDNSPAIEQDPSRRGHRRALARSRTSPAVTITVASLGSGQRSRFAARCDDARTGGEKGARNLRVTTSPRRRQQRGQGESSRGHPCKASASDDCAAHGDIATRGLSQRHAVNVI